MAKDDELKGPEFAKMWEDEGEPVSIFGRSHLYTAHSTYRVPSFLLDLLIYTNHNVSLSLGATEAATLDE